MELRKKEHDATERLRGNIRAVVRIRPDEEEISCVEKVAEDVMGRTVKIRVPTKNNL